MRGVAAARELRHIAAREVLYGLRTVVLVLPDRSVLEREFYLGTLGICLIGIVRPCIFLGDAQAVQIGRARRQRHIEVPVRVLARLRGDVPVELHLARPRCAVRGVDGERPLARAEAVGRFRVLVDGDLEPVELHLAVRAGDVCADAAVLRIGMDLRHALERHHAACISRLDAHSIRYGVVMVGVDVERQMPRIDVDL